VANAERHLSITGLGGAPEVRPGDDLAGIVAGLAPSFEPGDIVVVSSKVVSKAEGREVRDRDRADVVADETVEVVAQRGDMTIARTRHGLVLAAAGVDSSNVASGSLLPLPLDPDGSARRIRAGLQGTCHVTLGVIISDTAGRPWRVGQTDIAIGVAGVTPVIDHSGTLDRHGNLLHVTAPAVADEIAAAAELVMPKAGGTPFAVVRGLGHLVTDGDGPGAAAIVRPADEDLFRRGTFDT
jgi:coenzyme F420-0:L-glutamate ligase / coenzyme F420-1:gamma-L-glutamate ligase